MSSTRSVRRTSARMREEAGLQGRRLVAISSRGEKKRNVSKCDANQQKPASDFVCMYAGREAPVAGSRRRRTVSTSMYASEKRSNSASSVEQTPGKHTTKSFRSHYCSGAPETKYVQGKKRLDVGSCVRPWKYIHFFCKIFSTWRVVRHREHREKTREKLAQGHSRAATFIVASSISHSLLPTYICLVPNSVMLRIHMILVV